MTAFWFLVAGLTVAAAAVIATTDAQERRALADRDRLNSLTDWDIHVAEAVALAETQLWEATAAHIAHMEAAELDDTEAVARWLA